MAYKIQYDPSLTHKYPVKKEKGHGSILHAVTIAIIFLALVSVCVTFHQSIYEFLIPGDAASTEAAFSDFIRQMQQGETVEDSLAAFCRQIIVYE